MKKTIAKWLVGWALKLDPEARELVAPVINGYVAGKVGNAVVITKKDRKNYEKECKNNGTRTSRRATQAELVRQAKTQINVLIGRKIAKMIEYNVIKGKDYTEVSGHLKVYVKDGEKV